MGRRENDASASVRIIPHSQEHLFDVGNANQLFPRSLILPKHRHLPAGDLVALDRTFFGKEGAHVFHKAARDGGVT
jgi:hypothetical protein